MEDNKDNKSPKASLSLQSSTSQKDWKDKIKDRLSHSSFSFYLGSSIAGIIRTFIGKISLYINAKINVGFPFEHPLDSIKT